MRSSLLAIAVLGAILAAEPVGAEVFAYPKAGQSQEAFQKDQFECHGWAKQQTGVDPTNPAPAAAPPAGGVVRGAARGAAVGAIGGAIGGDAGKGAAIGAGVGAATGAVRRRSQTRQIASAQQANVQRYEAAYKTCLQGRGYQVN